MFQNNLCAVNDGFEPLCLILVIAFSGFPAKFAFFYFFFLNGGWLQSFGFAKGFIYLAAYCIIYIVADEVHKTEGTHFEARCLQQRINGMKIGYSLFSQF